MEHEARIEIEGEVEKEGREREIVSPSFSRFNFFRFSFLFFSFPFVDPIFFDTRPPQHQMISFLTLLLCVFVFYNATL